MEAQNDRKVEREKEEEKIGAVADRSGGDEQCHVAVVYRVLRSS